jgi:cell wall-associated NlpC family hydrolase
VADPLADAATRASQRLERWQAAVAALESRAVEVAKVDAAIEANDLRRSFAEDELQSVPPTSADSTTTTTTAAATGADTDTDRRAELEAELDAARAEAANLAVERAAAVARQAEDEVVAEATALGHADARRALADMTAARIPPTTGANLDAVWSTTDPRRLVVLYTALRQVGDPYVFARSGPDLFDCSGLTLYAWQAVGVRLAHYSFTQRGQTPAVDTGYLQPGDLVFNLRARSGHVMLYLGVENGIVHAPSRGKRVEISRWRTVNGFGSPLAPSAGATLTQDAVVATAASATPNQAAATDSPAGPAATATQTTTIIAAPPTWLGSTAPGGGVTGTPNAALYEAVGTRYGIDPAVLAGRVAAVEASRRAAAATTAPTDATNADAGTAQSPEAGAGALALRPELAARMGVDPTDPAAAADAAARYLVVAADRLNGLRPALAALDLGAEAVEAHGEPLAGPVRELVDATLAEAERLRTPPPPPEPPLVVYAVAGLPPAPATRVTGSRRSSR